ncbi:uncharacterized protein RCC_10778 [Ramularia collo-cygni]|uniref:F-box domain-containing protein n=1 Tax=Ramularia collo-cygni TaxID=112498 RepID=A0A2D3VD94_9PEZI|nr:uncharacterized protein RCC_10778 [Ramularia collo-cygni]CZT25050.1 uncharacterized protein RCC_10778 [Ramularia collo-cygni]
MAQPTLINSARAGDTSMLGNATNQPLQQSAQPSPAAADTPSPPTRDPANKLFSVWELVENVLLHLTFNDLVRIQNVNRTFRSTAQSSKKLRQTLFLAPRAELQPKQWLYIKGWGEEISKLFSVPVDGTINRLDDSSIQRGFNAADRCIKQVERGILRKPIHHASPAVLNPLVFNKNDRGYYGFPAAPGWHRTLAGKKTKPPEATGEMLLTQPPVCELDLRINKYTSKYAMNNYFKVRNDAGLTVNDVLRELESHRQAGDETWVFFREDVWVVTQSEKNLFDERGADEWRELEASTNQMRGG